MECFLGESRGSASCASYAFVVLVLEAACVKELNPLSHAITSVILRSSDSLIGSIVLIIFYGYLLLRGARLLSDGSELLLEVISPGIIGGEDISASTLSIHSPAYNHCNHQYNREIVGQSTYLEDTSSCISCNSDIDALEIALHRPRVFQA